VRVSFVDVVEKVPKWFLNDLRGIFSVIVGRVWSFLPGEFGRRSVKSSKLLSGRMAGIKYASLRNILCYFILSLPTTVIFRC
jgi:hypothetical protein